MTKVVANITSVPTVIEVEVSPEQIVESFGLSVDELIVTKVNNVVADRLETLVQEPYYVRKVRDWMMESMDYAYMSELIARQYSTDQIVDEMMNRYDGDNPLSSEVFVNRLMQSSRFQTLVQNCVSNYLTGSRSLISNLINEAVEIRTANIVDDLVERAMAAMSERLKGNVDV